MGKREPLTSFQQSSNETCTAAFKQKDILGLQGLSMGNYEDKGERRPFQGKRSQFSSHENCTREKVERTMARDTLKSEALVLNHFGFLSFLRVLIQNSSFEGE